MPADDAVSVRHVIIGGALIAGTVALVAGAVVAGLTHWHLPLAGPGRVDDVPAKPTPALESAPQLRLRRELDDKQRLLTTSAWVDARAGIARIPIATAMTLLSEKGLRAAPAASAPGSASTAGAAGAVAAASAAGAGPAAMEAPR